MSVTNLRLTDKRIIFFSLQLPSDLVQEQVAFGEFACSIHLLSNNHDINPKSFMDNKRKIRDIQKLNDFLAKTLKNRF